MATQDESVKVTYEPRWIALLINFLVLSYFIYHVFHVEQWTILKIVVNALLIFLGVFAVCMNIYSVYIKKTAYIIDKWGIHDLRMIMGLGLIPWSNITEFDLLGFQEIRVYVNNKEEVIKRQNAWKRFILRRSNRFDKTPVILSSINTDYTLDRFYELINLKRKQYQFPDQKKDGTIPLVIKFKRITFINDLLPLAFILLVMTPFALMGKHILWVIIGWIIILLPMQLLWLYRRIAKKTAYTFDDRGIQFHYGLYAGKTLEWKNIEKLRAHSLWWPIAWVPGYHYFLLFTDNGKELTTGLNWFQRQLASFNNRVFKTPVFVHASYYIDYSFDEIGAQLLDHLKKYQK